MSHGHSMSGGAFVKTNIARKMRYLVMESLEGEGFEELVNLYFQSLEVVISFLERLCKVPL